MAGKMAVEGAEPLRYNGYKVPLMRNLVKRAIAAWRRQHGHNRVGQKSVGPERPDPHRLVFLMWVSAIAGMLFLIVHAIYVRYFAKQEEFAGATLRRKLPRACPNDSRTALAGARDCFTGSWRRPCSRCCSPRSCRRSGVQFAWVTYHWIAGIVLTVSIIFHIIHASFWLDFWSIWPDKADIEDASRRFKRAHGQAAPRCRGSSPSIRSRTRCITASSCWPVCRSSSPACS